MVFDACVEGCKDNFSCGYAGWFEVSCEIIRGWNEELAKLFEKKYGHYWDRSYTYTIPSESKRKELDEKMNEILNKYDKPYNEGMKLFIHPCNEFNYTPAECELLLAVFERVDPDKFNNYNKNDNKWYKKVYIIWIRMLKYAIENNENLHFG